MKKKIAGALKTLLLGLIIILLPGCATLASDPASYGCQSADAVTTLYALHRGANELNPLDHALLAAGGAPLFIAAKIVVAWMITKIEREDVRASVNAATCAIAARNVMVTR